MRPTIGDSEQEEEQPWPYPAQNFFAQFGTGFVAPLILGAANKSGRQEAGFSVPVRHTYEVTHDWGELPADIQYGKHAWRVRRLSGTHLHSPHCVRHQREAGQHGGVRFVRGSSSRVGERSFAAARTAFTSIKNPGTSFSTCATFKRGLVTKTTLNGRRGNSH